MKAKLIVDGKEFTVDISKEKLVEITNGVTNKVTEVIKYNGYNRKLDGLQYYIINIEGKLDGYIEMHDNIDNSLYKIANYYSDKDVAENNARADKLLRQLRRFAVEHRKTNIDWKNEDCSQCKYYLYYSHDDERIGIDFCYYNYQAFGQIYFDKKETAQLAINTFKDELLWYFTEYKDSL